MLEGSKELFDLLQNFCNKEYGLIDLIVQENGKIELIVEEIKNKKIKVGIDVFEEKIFKEICTDNFNFEYEFIDDKDCDEREFLSVDDFINTIFGGAYKASYIAKTPFVELVKKCKEEAYE